MNVLEVKLDKMTKKELLETFAKKVAEVEGISYEVILQDYLNREESYSTGLENEFAIPHCRTIVNDTYIVFGEINGGVDDYKTLDDSQGK